MRKSGSPVELFVDADGPAGSGRFLRITVGVAGPGSTAPVRGFCLETSTAGWRTLQRFGRMPLPWVADLDGDGKPELGLWESFALAEDASSSAVGLVAWAYRFDSQGAFTVQWEASRALARELAAAYRKPFEAPDRSLAIARSTSGRALEAFANAECAIGPSPRAIAP